MQKLSTFFPYFPSCNLTSVLCNPFPAHPQTTPPLPTLLPIFANTAPPPLSCHHHLIKLTLPPQHHQMSTPSQPLYDQFILPTYSRFPLEISRGSGASVWDTDGNEYLDFSSGIAVCSLGHCHPAVSAAVTSQANRLVHCSNLFYSEPQALLASRLNQITSQSGRCFFCNSGAEANEGLIKLVRRFGNATGRRFKIITFTSSFHGRTFATISATGQDKVKTGFAPLLDGFLHLPFGDQRAITYAAADPTVAAILIEPIQGEGGIHPAQPEFLLFLRQLCDKHDLLLLYDEIQCGLGRTGHWCAWQSIAPDAKPDAISWAKGIANGFPLGAFWVRNESIASGFPLHNLLNPGSHATTYGGNPVCCAAALAVLDTIEKDNLLQNVALRSSELKNSLANLSSPLIADIRGIGLMLGIELSP
ncbi:MAG: acetylornithine transaminase, partial [Chthoniobacterales bacterium]|nr:acetylornithine transaminase [Chthoniobacterales bacterium]